MAKVVQYKPDPGRKLGFKKVSKESRKGVSGQLDLFSQTNKEKSPIQMLRHLDPFEKGLNLDDKNDSMAEVLYLQSIEQGISVADAYCNLGIIYARRGQTSKAISHFTNALKEDPRHVEGHYNLANMYYDAGNYPLAQTHYEIALELEDGFPEIHYNLALTDICLDDKESAIAHMRSYVELSCEEQKDEAQRLLSMLESSI